MQVFLGQHHLDTDVNFLSENLLILRAKTFLFLDVTLKQRCNGVVQTQAILKSIQGAQNGVRCMTSSLWGTSAPTLLHAHDALVLSRICYALAYYTPSETQFLKPERAHRAGLKRVLGVPIRVSTAQLYTKAHPLPITDIVE